MSEKVELSRELFDEMLAASAKKARLEEQTKIIQALQKLLADLEQTWIQ